MGKKKTDEGVLPEDTRARSLRLARQRVSTAIVRLRLVANLGGVTYQLTDDEKAKIMATLNLEVTKIQASFDGDPVKEHLFTL